MKYQTAFRGSLEDTEDHSPAPQTIIAEASHLAQGQGPQPPVNQELLEQILAGLRRL